MRIYHKIDGSLVLMRNPRTEEWEIITNFLTEEAAKYACDLFNNHEFNGWKSTKLSKSNQG